MATQYANGKIVTSGLVLALDAADRNSYVSGSTVWNDVSGNGNSGSLINGPTFSNNSIVFDGTNDYVTGSLPTLNSWSVSLWYLSTDITSQLVFYPFAGSSGVHGLGFGGTFSPQTNNRWYFFDGTNVFSDSSTAITTNTWYNLVVTKSSTTYNLYTNGLLSLNATGADITFTQYTLGVRGDGFWFAKGNIANAQIYNRVLLASEILQNYNAQKSRFNL
jgi:hypothetical protein